MRKTIPILVAALVLGLLGWRIWSKIRADSAPGERRDRNPAMAVEVAAVRQGEIRDVRIFTGSLLSRARYVVAPKIGGRLETLAVNIGDPVEPGRLIAELDDEEYVQQVAQARATLDVAQATVEQHATALSLAEREMERGRALREKKIASEAEWDQAEAEYKAQGARYRVAQAQMAEKESALKAAEVRLSYTRIRLPQEAPEAGRWFVEERYVDEGAMLGSNAPIIAVTDIGKLVAIINVIERDYPDMRIGLAVDIETDAFPGQTFSGTVVRMAPALREASRQARVEVEIPNDKLLLRPGMFVRARIDFARHENATLVPRDALVKREGQPGVFLVDPADKKARFVAVTSGIQSADAVEILEPKISGIVVTLGQHLLSDGSSVILPEPSGAPEREGTALPTTEGQSPGTKGRP
ncbi:MAG: efflux RND transporter periplasmic adaptor subunit [Planctomycetota bacterium]